MLPRSTFQGELAYQIPLDSHPPNHDAWGMEENKHYLEFVADHICSFLFFSCIGKACVHTTVNRLTRCLLDCTERSRTHHIWWCHFRRTWAARGHLSNHLRANIFAGLFFLISEREALGPILANFAQGKFAILPFCGCSSRLQQFWILHSDDSNDSDWFSQCFHRLLMT